MRWRFVRYNDDIHVRDIVVDERHRWRALFQQGREPQLAGSQTPAVPLPTEDATERE